MATAREPGLPNFTFLLDPPPPTYLAVLGIPPEAEVISVEMTELQRLDSRLAGCIWQVLGCVVPCTSHRPDYPFMRLLHHQIQIWLWRTYRPPVSFFAEMRWHPETGETWSLGGFTPDDPFQNCQLAWRWLQISQRESQRGRPLGAGYYASDAEALAQIRAAIRQIEATQYRATQQRVANSLSKSVSYLQHLCKRQGISWNTLVRQSREESR
jgi:hypothetical protein